MEKLKQPTEKQWRRLYELAVKLKELQPWEWMEESDIFGVQHPETGEIGFVSTMGAAGEHYAIGVYLGAEGLFGYFDLGGEMEIDPMALFDVPQLQISFENREELEKQDHALIKKLGLKFRGSHSYPMFRSIKPGFLPYQISSAEAQVLIHVIEQTLNVAPRFQGDELLLADLGSNDDEPNFLVRVPTNQGGNIVWKDENLTIEPPPDSDISITIPQEVTQLLKNLPQNKNLVIEIDLFYSPTPVAESGRRPFIPKMLMLADAKSGLILGFKLIEPQETELENFSEHMENIFESLEKLNVRPNEIWVSSEYLFKILRSFTQQLNVKLKQVDELKAIEEAKEGMFGFFGG